MVSQLLTSKDLWGTGYGLRHTSSPVEKPRAMHRAADRLAFGARTVALAVLPKGLVDEPHGAIGRACLGWVGPVVGRESFGAVFE